jgi:hypothetical protein
MQNIYGSADIWGDLLIRGSFSVLGSASSIDTTSLLVSDTIIALGHSQSGSPILDEGIMFSRGTGLTQAFIWDESDNTFSLIGTNDDHTVVGSINIDSYSSLRVGGLTTSTLKITDGATDGYILKSDVDGNASWQSNDHIISDTYANLQSLRSSDSLLTGYRYYITDRKIWVDAIGGSTFSSSALRQQTILDNSAYSTINLWNSSLTPNIGDKVRWGGKLWENVNGLVGSKGDNSSLDTEWDLLTSDPLYVEKIFTIEYNFINDRIGNQSDDRGNIVLVNIDYDDFTLITDWGDENIKGNITIGIFNNVSNSIDGNMLSVYIYENVVGYISRNTGGVICNNTCSEIVENKFQEIINNNLPGNDIRENVVFSVVNNSNNGDIRNNIGYRIYGNTNNNYIAANTTTIIWYNSNNGVINNNYGNSISWNSNNGDISGNNSFNTIQYNISPVVDILINKSIFINSNENTGDIKWNNCDILNNSNLGLISYNNVSEGVHNIGTYSVDISYKSCSKYFATTTIDSSTQSMQLGINPTYLTPNITIYSVDAVITARKTDSSKGYYAELKGLFNNTNSTQIGTTDILEKTDFTSATCNFGTASLSYNIFIDLFGEPSTDIIWDVSVKLNIM